MVWDKSFTVRGQMLETIVDFLFFFLFLASLLFFPLSLLVLISLVSPLMFLWCVFLSLSCFVYLFLIIIFLYVCLLFVFLSLSFPSVFITFLLFPSFVLNYRNPSTLRFTSVSLLLPRSSRNWSRVSVCCNGSQVQCNKQVEMCNCISIKDGRTNEHMSLKIYVAHDFEWISSENSKLIVLKKKDK